MIDFDVRGGKLSTEATPPPCASSGTWPVGEEASEPHRQRDDAGTAETDGGANARSH